MPLSLSIYISFDGAKSINMKSRDTRRHLILNNYIFHDYFNSIFRHLQNVLNVPELRIFLYNSGKRGLKD